MRHAPAQPGDRRVAGICNQVTGWTAAAKRQESIAGGNSKDGALKPR
jgi:hypothetical protein